MHPPLLLSREDITWQNFKAVYNWNSVNQSEACIHITWPPRTNEKPVFTSPDHSGPMGSQYLYHLTTPEVSNTYMLVVDRAGDVEGHPPFPLSLFLLN